MIKQVYWRRKMTLEKFCKFTQARTRNEEERKTFESLQEKLEQAESAVDTQNILDGKQKCKFIKRKYLPLPEYELKNYADGKLIIFNEWLPEILVSRQDMVCSGILHSLRSVNPEISEQFENQVYALSFKDEPNLSLVWNYLTGKVRNVIYTGYEEWRLGVRGKIVPDPRK